LSRGSIDHIDAHLYALASLRRSCKICSPCSRFGRSWSTSRSTRPS
jgi:hypothetical protein